ncbi:hypothetical protein DPSP01_007057 [Paraphaeosphaeria sporulosa]
MPTHVALAGATGLLGPVILAALLAAEHKVTVLTRVGSMAAEKLSLHPNMSVRQVDLADAGSIIPALGGVSVVVSSPPGPKRTRSPSASAKHRTPALPLTPPDLLRRSLGSGRAEPAHRRRRRSRRHALHPRRIRPGLGQPESSPAPHHQGKGSHADAPPCQGARDGRRLLLDRHRQRVVLGLGAAIHRHPARRQGEERSAVQRRRRPLQRGPALGRCARSRVHHRQAGRDKGQARVHPLCGRDAEPAAALRGGEGWEEVDYECEGVGRVAEGDLGGRGQAGSWYCVYAGADFGVFGSGVWVRLFGT